MSKIFKPTVSKIPIHRGGRIDSAKLSSIFDQMVNDIIGLSEFNTQLSAKVDDNALTMYASDRDLRQRVMQLSSEVEALRIAAAEDNADIIYSITMYDSSKVDFLEDSTFANRCIIDTVFGDAIIPINGVQPGFWMEAVSTHAIIPIEDLSITVTGTFDNGDGVTNHESGGTVNNGEQLNAFNGNNTTRWLRKVSYPLYNDTTEVLCEITIDVPEGASGQANCIYVVPAPSGDVDILGVYTSPDLGNSFSLISGFEQVDGAGPRRWFFPAQNVQRVKIRMRQRNWIEEDGQKVFYYGAQEIGLMLYEFDKTYNVSNPIEQNHTFVLKQDAPEGYVFNEIKSITTDPMFTLEDPGVRHVHIKVATDLAFTSVLWDSDSDTLPQLTAGLDLGGTAATLYFLVTMNWVGTSGGSSSPFPVYTTPVFRGINLQARVEAE